MTAKISCTSCKQKAPGNPAQPKPNPNSAALEYWSMEIWGPTRHDGEDLLHQLRVEGLVELGGHAAARKHDQQLHEQVQACRRRV